MKYVALTVFVVAMSLMTGCAGMTCPMGKNSPENAGIGRYQLQSVSNGSGSGSMYKIDTKTGDTWQNVNGRNWTKFE